MFTMQNWKADVCVDAGGIFAGAKFICELLGE